jgi:hypothetical protein
MCVGLFWEESHKGPLHNSSQWRVVLLALYEHAAIHKMVECK